MSIKPMILVFDTNVFLQKNANLWELMEHFPRNQTPPKFLVAVDDGEALIENEYIDWATREDPEAPIRVITERICDGSSLFVVRKPARLSPNLHQRLRVNRCTETVELRLFGVAESTKKAILVYPNEPNGLPIPRGYLRAGVLHCIQHGRNKLQISTLAESLKLIRAQYEHSPDSMTDLQMFLECYRVGSKKSDEREFIEFKETDAPFLSQRILRKAVRAVCGMLNSRDGLVFIGVDDAGEIKPFPPRYNSNSKPICISQLLVNIYEEIERICPCPRCLVHAWPILDDKKENCVVVIHIYKGNQQYLYRNEHRDPKKEKLNSIKWIRSGARTIPDPNWPGCTGSV